MLPVNNGSFQPLQHCAAYWNDRLKQAAAVCNGLTWVSKRSVVGDDLETKLFVMVEARFVVTQGLFLLSLLFVIECQFHSLTISNFSKCSIFNLGTPTENRPKTQGNHTLCCHAGLQRRGFIDHIAIFIAFIWSSVQSCIASDTFFSLT